jgi:hypothetical protein
MNLAINNIIKSLARRSPLGGITLDYTNKRVYWIQIDISSYIFSSDYDFQHEKKIKNGEFSYYMLAIFGDSLYFEIQKRNAFSINQVNVSNGNSIRSILVDTAYEDIIVFHSSLQPMGM